MRLFSTFVIDYSFVNDDFFSSDYDYSFFSLSLSLVGSCASGF